MGTAISATACHQEEEYPSVPEVTEPQPTGEIIPTMDRQKELKDARKKYSDAVVWLYMPDAEVDDPVVQAKDNAYYLQKDENGNYSEWGCYYAHCDNHLSSRSKLDRNTVIFGHSASNCDPDGPKLTKLHRYMDADYVKENPYVYLSVKGEDMVFQITACFITDARQLSAFQIIERCSFAAMAKQAHLFLSKNIRHFRPINVIDFHNIHLCHLFGGRHLRMLCCSNIVLTFLTRILTKLPKSAHFWLSFEPLEKSSFFQG